MIQSKDKRSRNKKTPFSIVSMARVRNKKMDSKRDKERGLKTAQ